MDCRNCVFFSNNSVLSCAVNPSYKQSDAEPCRDFEQVSDPCYAYTYSFQVHYIAEEYEIPLELARKILEISSHANISVEDAMCSYYSYIDESLYCND